MDTFLNFKILVILLLLVLLSGCADKVELEDRTIVTTLGIDAFSFSNYISPLDQDISYYDTHDNLYNYRVSLNAKDLYNLEDLNTLICDSRSIPAAINEINQNTTGDVYLGLAETIVLGDKLLQDTVLLKNTLDTLLRDSELNKDVLVFATTGFATNIIEQKIDFRQTNKNWGDSNTLEEIARSLYQKGDATIPYINVSGSKTVQKGLGIIKDYERIGFLNKRELDGYMLLSNTDINTTLFTTLYGNDITLDISSIKKDVNFVEEDELTLELSLQVKGHISSYNLDSLHDKDTLQILENKYEQKIERELEKIFYLLNQDYNTDILGFREALFKQNNELYNKHNLQTLIINANVNLEITGIGYIT